MLAERLEADELMDDPALPAGTYRYVLADLARVNRATFAYRTTLDFMRRATGSRKAFRLLDVGFGQGDMLRRIARWAEKRGIAAELVGMDLNPNSVAAAEAVASPDAPFSCRTCTRITGMRPRLNPCPSRCRSWCRMSQMRPKFATPDSRTYVSSGTVWFSGELPSTGPGRCMGSRLSSKPCHRSS
jgi:hypothetical protein